MICELHYDCAECNASEREAAAQALANTTAAVDAAYYQGFEDGAESMRQKLSGKYGTRT